MSDRVTRFVGAWHVGEPVNPQELQKVIAAATEQGGFIRGCTTTLEAAKGISLNEGDDGYDSSGEDRFAPVNLVVDETVKRGSLEVAVQP